MTLSRRQFLLRGTGILACGGALWPQAARQIPNTTGLPLVSDEAAYWWSRALGVTSRNPGPAVLVSRFRFQRLRAFRSWQDFGALQEYVDWADRPEAAAFDGKEVVADVSANDLVLLRVPAAAVKAPVPLRADPIGFAVLDPRRAGPVRIPVTVVPGRGAVPSLPRDLPSAPIPVINAAVHSGKNHVVIYGSWFTGRKVRVLSRGGEGKLIHVSANQLNAVMPSVDEVAVEVDSLRSEWSEVQR